MAANYLDVQQQLEDVRNYNKELEDQLEASEIEMKKVAEETDSEEGKKFVQLQTEKVFIAHCLYMDLDGKKTSHF